MTTKSSYQFEVPFRVAGIPALIGVYDYYCVKPWRGSVYSCPSDIDYYGDEGFEYDILDRKGYHAKWLEKKLTPSMKDDIREAVLNHIKECSKDDY